jgi:hypothetical protein
VIAPHRLPRRLTGRPSRKRTRRQGSGEDRRLPDGGQRAFMSWEKFTSITTGSSRRSGYYTRYHVISMPEAGPDYPNEPETPAEGRQ